jgi:hypothetical protein
MYRAAERFGFKGGRVLEPACGIGHFVGLMPEDMLRRSTVTGIEIDPLTARIAKALYPDADIRAQPFEQTKLADGFYDLWPFPTSRLAITPFTTRVEQLQVFHPRLFLCGGTGKSPSRRSGDVHHVAGHDGQTGFDAA